MGTSISFPRTNGGTATGYLATSGEPDAPSVVVIHEWWGVQGQVRAVCDRFAQDGFDALAPDLFEGKTIPYHDRDAARAAMASLDFESATGEIVRGAVRHLQARGKVGIAGFCMGGAVAFVGAVHVPEVSAAVVFYGLPPEEIAAPEGVRVPLQGHFANRDDWVTPKMVDDLEARLQAAKKTAEIYRYEAAHAFMNQERKDAYDAKAAKLAWERCVSFFANVLKAR